MFASLNAGKLLPYQDYLLYKPTGSVRTKAYFQQKSDSSVGNNSYDELSKATLDEEFTVTAVNSEASEDVSESAVSEKVAERGMELTVHHTEPDDQHSSHLSLDLCEEAADVAVGDTQQPSSPLLSVNSANEVAEMSSSHTDCDQMSAENRKRVSEFFSHSRLHHISTWGAEYKAYVTQLQAQVSAASVCLNVWCVE